MMNSRWTHLHVKPTRKSHIRRLSQYGGSGFHVAVKVDMAVKMYMAVTGCTWQLQDVRGCYRMYVATYQ